MNDEMLVPKCGMREMIWKCLDKAKALELLIGHGFSKEAFSSLAVEVSSSLEDILETYDRCGDEQEGGAE